jgi:hypothetical protein
MLSGDGELANGVARWGVEGEEVAAWLEVCYGDGLVNVLLACGAVGVVNAACNIGNGDGVLLR